MAYQLRTEICTCGLHAIITYGPHQGQFFSKSAGRKTVEEFQKHGFLDAESAASALKEIENSVLPETIENIAEVLHQAMHKHMVDEHFHQAIDALEEEYGSDLSNLTQSVFPHPSIH